MNQPDFNLAESKIAIIGLGLMGGSLALALKGKCSVLYGIDPHHDTLGLALSQNIVDHADADPAKFLPEADVLILSAPVPAILTLLEQLPAYTKNPCIVMDLGSTKKMIVESMSRLPGNFDPIGGHPICGKEKLSLANAERTLYYSAPFLLTPLQRTSKGALAAAHRIVEAVGAKPVLLDAIEHDRIIASTSHFPFLISSALVLTTPDDVAPFIGPGFKSASRLAGTSSSMMLGVLQSNRENVLNVLSELQRQLSEIKTVLEDDDYSKLKTILNDAQNKYQHFIQ